MTPDEIYDLLVKEAGAPECDREDFIYHFGRTPEYRFMGSLGFGGKFRYGSTWINGQPVNNRASIDCYLEDLTPERAAIIKKVNRLLEEGRTKP